MHIFVFGLDSETLKQTQYLWTENAGQMDNETFRDGRI
jgi:hypothetical protein